MEHECATIILHLCAIANETTVKNCLKNRNVCSVLIYKFSPTDITNVTKLPTHRCSWYTYNVRDRQQVSVLRYDRQQLFIHSLEISKNLRGLIFNIFGIYKAGKILNFLVVLYSCSLKTHQNSLPHYFPLEPPSKIS